MSMIQSSAQIVALKPWRTGNSVAPLPVQAWIISLSAQASLAMLDLPAGEEVPRAARGLDGQLGGVRLPRPVLSTAVPLRSGATRHIVVLRTPAEDVARQSLTLTLGGVTVGFVDPDWLQSPLAEAVDLVEGITAEGRMQLLKLIFLTVPSFLGRGQSGEFVAAARALLSLLDVPVCGLLARYPLGASGQVATWPFPAALPEAALTPVALDERRIERLRPCPALVDEAGRLQLFLPGTGAVPDVLVLQGGAPVLLRGGAPQPQPFGRWLDGRVSDAAAAARRWGAALLRSHEARDPAVAALLRERDLAPGEQPRLTLHHLAATRGGLLVWADLHDPGRLVSHLRVDCDGGEVDLPVPESRQVRAFLPSCAPQPGADCRLRAVFGSGLVRTLHDGAPAAFTGSLPPGIATDDPLAAGEALAAAWADRAPVAVVARVEDFGPQAARPRLSLLMPLTANPDLVRARAAIVAAEPDGAKVELIYVAPGAPNDAVRRLLGETAEVYGAAHRLFSLEGPGHEADRLILALGEARAARVLMLGAEVLPDAPGWLSTWLRLLGRKSGAAMIGGTILTCDRSVAEAGGALSRPAPGGPVLPVPRLRGLPVADLGSSATAETEMLSVEALGLNADGLQALMTLGARGPDPDALAIAARLGCGGARTAFNARFVRYAPAPAIDDIAVAAGLWQIGARLDGNPVDGGEEGV